MILGLEIGMLIAGIIALVKGSLRLSGKHVVEGISARLMGLILLLPLPLAFAVGFLIGFGEGLQGKPVQAQELQGTLTGVEVIIVVVCLMGALGIGFASAQTPADQRPSPRSREDAAEEPLDVVPVGEGEAGGPSGPQITSAVPPRAADAWVVPQRREPAEVVKPRRSATALMFGLVLVGVGLLAFGGLCAVYWALHIPNKPHRPSQASRRSAPVRAFRQDQLPRSKRPAPLPPVRREWDPEPEPPKDVEEVTPEPPKAEEKVKPGLPTKGGSPFGVLKTLGDLGASLAKQQKDDPESGRPDTPYRIPFAVDPKLADAKGKVFLSDMQEFATKAGPTGWSFAKGGKLGNSYVPGSTVKVEGKKYAKGLSMHPPWRDYQRACYALGKRAKTLSGAFALNGDLGRAIASSTQLVVIGDGKVLWRSVPIQKTDIIKEFTIDVSEVDVLELRTLTENGLVTDAHAVVLDPYVTLK
jgi:hypothetical protein